MNQLRLKSGPGQHGNECRVIAKVNGRVRCRTYTFQARTVGSKVGFVLLIIEGAYVAERGWTWDAHDAWEWLEKRTGAIRID